MADDCNAGLKVAGYGSEAPDFVLGDPGVHIEHPRFQLFCRHTDFDSGLALIEKAYELLAAVVNQTLVTNGAKYLRIEPLQSPFQLEPPQDAQGRWEWFVNFRTEKALG